VYIILRSFLLYSYGIHELDVIIYASNSHFTVWHSSLMIFAGFETFLTKHWPSKVKFVTHHGCPPAPMPIERKGARINWGRGPHKLSLVDATICARPVTTLPVHFPWLSWLRMNEGVLYLDILGSSNRTIYLTLEFSQVFLQFYHFGAKRDIREEITYDLKAWRLKNCQNSALLLSKLSSLLFELHWNSSC